MKVYMLEGIEGRELMGVHTPAGTKMSALIPEDFSGLGIEDENAENMAMPAYLDIAMLSNHKDAPRLCAFFALKVMEIVPPREGFQRSLFVEKDELKMSSRVFEESFLTHWRLLLPKQTELAQKTFSLKLFIK